jgi:hypothetical protein
MALKGIKLSEEHKRKLSESHKGKSSGMKGKKHSRETLIKMSELKTGERHPGWKGGISEIDYSNKRWKKNNPEKVAFINERRRSMKRNAEGSHTFGEWELLKKQYGYRCPGCGRKEPEIKLTEDHIIPLSKGGSDYIENIQPLCGSCNSRKKDKIKVVLSYRDNH